MKNESKLNRVVVAVDVMISAISKDGLEVLLVKIRNGPYVNCWALPGSVVGVDEGLDETAKRIVQERVGDDRLHLEQLYCFGKPDRDIRGRSVAVAYFSLLSDMDKIKPKLADNYLEIKWQLVERLPKMAYDHREMIEMAKQELAHKLNEVGIIKPLLPEKFTLSELRRVYEILSGKRIDKRNFVKKIKNEGVVASTGQTRGGDAHRPAKLFYFNNG